MAAGLTSSTTTTTTATASEVESAVAEPIGTPGGVAVNEVSAETEVLTAAEQAWGRPYGEPLESRAETLGSLSAVECEQEEEIQDPDADQDTSPIVNLEDAAAVWAWMAHHVGTALAFDTVIINIVLGLFDSFHRSLCMLVAGHRALE
jgi:hypothetical protein